LTNIATVFGNGVSTCIMNIGAHMTSFILIEINETYFILYSISYSSR